MQRWEYLELAYERVDEYRGGKHDMDHWSGAKWKWSDGDNRGVEARLNALGNDGWELVSAYPESRDIGPAFSGRTNYIYYLLKRPK